MQRSLVPQQNETSSKEDGVEGSWAGFTEGCSSQRPGLLCVHAHPHCVGEGPKSFTFITAHCHEPHNCDQQTAISG